MSSPHKSLRLPDALLERIEAIARAQGIKFSSAMRLALMRGVTAMEREAGPPAPPRRKVISRGVY